MVTADSNNGKPAWQLVLITFGAALVTCYMAALLQVRGFGDYGSLAISVSLIAFSVGFGLAKTDAFARHWVWCVPLSVLSVGIPLLLPNSMTTAIEFPPRAAAAVAATSTYACLVGPGVICAGTFARRAFPQAAPLRGYSMIVAAAFVAITCVRLTEGFVRGTSSNAVMTDSAVLLWHEPLSACIFAVIGVVVGAIFLAKLIKSGETSQKSAARFPNGFAGAQLFLLGIAFVFLSEGTLHRLEGTFSGAAIAISLLPGVILFIILAANRLALRVTRANAQQVLYLGLLVSLPASCLLPTVLKTDSQSGFSAAVICFFSFLPVLRAALLFARVLLRNHAPVGAFALYVAGLGLAGLITPAVALLGSTGLLVTALGVYVASAACYFKSEKSGLLPMKTIA